MIEASAKLGEYYQTGNRDGDASGNQDGNAPPPLKTFNGMDTAILLEENIVRILSYLGPKDVSTCRLVNREWKRLVDDYHLVPLSFYRSCHRLKYLPNPHTAERYYSSTRDWLKGFGSVSDKSLAQLEQFAGHKHFPEMVFFFTAKALAETRYLRCAPVATFEHSDLVNSVNFSPCGKLFVTACVDKTAKICGLVDGQWQVIAIVQHSDCVANASFSPDGNQLVTISTDKIVKICAVVDGQWQEIAAIEHPDGVRDARFGPDGKQLLTACMEGKTVKIYELVGGELKKIAAIQHSDIVLDVSFSPDGKHLVTVSKDQTAKICGLVGGQWQEVAAIEHSDWVRNASLSPDEKYLATASNLAAKIYRLVDGQWQKIATIDHSDWVGHAIFSPDGKHLMTASGDGTAKVWGLVSGYWQQKAIIRHFGWVTDVSFSLDGKYLATACSDRHFNVNIFMLADPVHDNFHEASLHHGWKSSFNDQKNSSTQVSKWSKIRRWMIKTFAKN